MVLFVILLPVMILFSGIAINMAYMQLTTTELKVATDAAAKAGGRAMSIHQTTDSAMNFARSTAAANLVAGRGRAKQNDAASPITEIKRCACVGTNVVAQDVDTGRIPDLNSRIATRVVTRAVAARCSCTTASGKRLLLRYNRASKRCARAKSGARATAVWRARSERSSQFNRRAAAPRM